MTNYCCITGCKYSEEVDPGILLMRIPYCKQKGKHTYDYYKKFINDLIQKRKKLWIEKINRPDITERNASRYKVCSNHFLSGRCSDLLDEWDPDWAPTQMLLPNTIPEENIDVMGRLFHSNQNLDRKDSPDISLKKELGTDRTCTITVIADNTKSAVSEHNFRPKRVNTKRFYPAFDCYKCDICNQTFMKRSSMALHINRRHKMTKLHVCNVCGRKFADGRNLKDHINRHNNLKAFVCDECGKGFVTRVELRCHVRSHTGEKNFTCTACGKRFATSGVCTTHIQRSHAKERRFTCNYVGCNQAYFKNTDLKIHIRSHTGERPLKCNVCNKSFADPKILLAHSKIHRSEKQYQCNFCLCKFSQASGRWGHEKRIHGTAV